MRQFLESAVPGSGSQGATDVLSQAPSGVLVPLCFTFAVKFQNRDF